MPFQIVRNDIVNMHVDAIVNTANPEPVIGSGVDTAIHLAAGPRLLAARQKIGPIAVGDAAITNGYALDAKYVIHAVGPLWQGGGQNEETLLRSCYDRALALAAQKRCGSIAFPLISTGNYGFPKALAMQVAMRAFSSFLIDHEMQIYLVVFGRESFTLSEKLFHGVTSYIDENYVHHKLQAEYAVFDGQRPGQTRVLRPEPEWHKPCAMPMAHPAMAAPTAAPRDLEAMLQATDAGFSETLLKLIDRTGRKDSDIYKKANIDRKLFSKIRKNRHYKPSKSTALAFAIALELDLEETKDFIGRAGYALTHSSKFDIIIEYFITQGNYDIYQINETLFFFDQSLLGA